ncbi:unnamed protein product [Malus baccata var. baccata]
MLMQGDQMFVPNVEELKKDILDEVHISAYAMHPGSTKMYHTIRHFYYWPGSFGIEITLQHRLSSPNRWVVRENYPDFGRYVEIVSSTVWRRLAQALTVDRYWYGPEIDERVFVGPEIVEETTQNIQVIKANLKAAQDRQKSIADRHSIDRVYKVGDWVFLKLSPWKGVVRFGKKVKLSPRYIGLYQIVERVGEIAYRLALPPELARVHNVFHVSMLRRYVSDPSHINPDLTYDEVPVSILDWKDKVLRNKIVWMVKVLWRNHSVKEATWETKELMRDMYPRLFYGFDSS